MTRTTGRFPFQIPQLVLFHNGPWDGLTLHVEMPAPAKIVVRAVPPPRERNGRAWRLAELLDPEVAGGGTHVYRRHWDSGAVWYQYAGQG